MDWLDKEKILLILMRDNVSITMGFFWMKSKVEPCRLIAKVDNIIPLWRCGEGSPYQSTIFFFFSHAFQTMEISWNTNMVIEHSLLAYLPSTTENSLFWLQKSWKREASTVTFQSSYEKNWKQLSRPWERKRENIQSHTYSSYRNL